MAVVAKSCLACDSFARNGPFFKTAPIFGFVCCRRIPWPAQHSVRLPCISRGGRSMFCADANDAWQAQHFRKQGL